MARHNYRGLKVIRGKELTLTEDERDALDYLAGLERDSKYNGPEIDRILRVAQKHSQNCNCMTGSAFD